MSDNQPQNNNLLNPSYGSKVAETKAGQTGKSHHQFFKAMEEHQPVKQFRKITRQQLAMHKTVDSAWLSLNGVVYDVTVYQKHHPGGKIILQGCGKQCYDLFNAHHPWVNAKYLLEKYKLGYLSY